MADFIQHDLGYRKREEVVVVTLQGSAANVRLMDSSNFNSYRNGRQHRYTGGLAKQSPVRLAIPNAGHWYVTVDMQGVRGTVRSGVRIEGAPLGPLPDLRQSRRPLETIRHAAHPEWGAGDPSVVDDAPEWDVLISHATEDKAAVAEPLAVALQALGLTVWLDLLEIRIGDSLRRKIDQGRARSRFGVVILSRHFFSKQWPQYELDGLVTRQNDGEQSPWLLDHAAAHGGPPLPIENG